MEYADPPLDEKGSSYCNWLFYQGLPDLSSASIFGTKFQRTLTSFAIMPSPRLSGLLKYLIQIATLAYETSPPPIFLFDQYFAFSKAACCSAPQFHIYCFLTRQYNEQKHSAKWGMKVHQYPIIPKRDKSLCLFWYAVGLCFVYDSLGNNTGLTQPYDSPKLYCIAQILNFYRFIASLHCRWSNKTYEVFCSRGNLHRLTYHQYNPISQRLGRKTTTRSKPPSHGI